MSKSLNKRWNNVTRCVSLLLEKNFKTEALKKLDFSSICLGIKRDAYELCISFNIGGILHDSVE